MKTILCFGDSNTWGYDPAATATSPFPRRHPADVRWTGVLAAALGPGWRVIEEGQNGRTTVHDDPLMPHTNGRRYLPACLESHKPIDLVVLMLGTNDLKAMFNLPAAQIAAGAGLLVRMIRQSEAGPEARPPRVLLVGPAGVESLDHLPDLAEKFAGAREKAARFPECYAAVAELYGCAFFDSQTVVATSRIDGLHLEAEAHANLGKPLAARIPGLFHSSPEQGSGL